MGSVQYYFNGGMTNIYVCVKGETGKISPEPFMDKLKVGDKITQIGDRSKKGMAYYNRQSDFEPFVTYSGIMKTDVLFNGNEVRMLCFRVPEQCITGGYTNEYYYLFGIFEPEGKPIELHICDPQNQTLIVHQIIFKKLNG